MHHAEPGATEEGGRRSASQERERRALGTGGGGGEFARPRRAEWGTKLTMYMGNVKENVSLGIHVARVAKRVIADDL